LTVAEFHANLWRGYQTRCDTTYNFGFGTFLGTFLPTSATTTNLTYMFTDFSDLVNPPQLQGSTLAFTSIFGVSSSGATTLNLTRAEGGTTTFLAKVSTMPTQTNVDIRLEGNATAFVGQVVTDFIAALATSLDIDARNIRITDVRSGSIIVSVEISDDAFSGVSSTTAPNVLAAAGSIGGYPVLSITNVTPGAANGAMHVAASWLLLFALIAAFL